MLDPKRPHQQRRWKPALSIIACLLIGMIINVAIAWLAAYDEERASRVLAYGKLNMLIDVPWPVAVPTDWPPRANIAKLEVHTYWDVWLYHDDFRDGKITHWVTLARFGWPMRSLSRDELVDAARTDETFRKQHQQPYWLLTTSTPANGGLEFLRLPIVPIWPGFAVNTLMFGAIAWLAWTSLVLGWRRLRRRRPGACGNCGYDIAGLNLGMPCPECGIVHERHEVTTHV